MLDKGNIECPGLPRVGFGLLFLIAALLRFIYFSEEKYI